MSILNVYAVRRYFICGRAKNRTSTNECARVWTKRAKSIIFLRNKFEKKTFKYNTRSWTVGLDGRSTFWNEYVSKRVSGYHGSRPVSFRPFSPVRRRSIITRTCTRSPCTWWECHRIMEGWNPDSQVGRLIPGGNCKSLCGRSAAWQRTSSALTSSIMFIAHTSPVFGGRNNVSERLWLFGNTRANLTYRKWMLFIRATVGISWNCRSDDCYH